MNVLIEEFPSAVEINGVEYSIETDFRVCLRIILAYEDPELTGLEKQEVLLDNLYSVRPSDASQAIELGIRFLNGGYQDQDSGDEDSSLRLYSFVKDARMIYAVFRQIYEISLETAEMHWWEFLALFSNLLGSDTSFGHLVNLRKRVKTNKATKEERRVAQEMGDLFDLPEPDTQTTEERKREAEFFRLMEKGQKHREAQKENSS